MNQLIKYIFSLSVLSVMVSCQNNKQQNTQKNVAVNNFTDTLAKVNDECAKLLLDAQKYDQIFQNATTLDANVALIGVVAFYNYANICHNDTLGPIYLFKAGQVCASINDADKARTMYEKCIADYPKFNNRGAALFLLAQLYDNQTVLHNEKTAKEIYQQIIKEYPNSSYATDAKAAIQNLGKSDEELVKEFLNKNK